jgi:hypothetical protein
LPGAQAALEEVEDAHGKVTGLRSRRLRKQVVAS